MKRSLSLILSAVVLLLSFQITIFADESDNLLTDEEYVTVNAETGKDSAEITAYSDLDAVVIKASYNDNGVLEDITVTDTIKLTKGVNTVKLAETVKEGDKIMVWDSLGGMKPYGSYIVPTASISTPAPSPDVTPTPTPDTTPKPTIDPNTTPKPNRLVDGDIETTTTLADGKWKPSVGEWKKGLGTSADIDTSNVSDNSTKSVKLTNAALYQALTLEGGENYSFSFDIYLGDSFDKSKLSWGIFSLADNGYVGGINCGYKEGTATTESNFDVNKKNEWQHVETEFLCASEATYVVEFLYGAPDSVYIDNVCLSGGKASAVTAEVHTVTYSDEDGEYTVYGTLYRPANQEKSGVIIYSHGFSGSGDDFKPHCEFMAKNGYAAYCYEFCGGSTKMQSKGRETTEMTIFTEKADLLAVFDYLSNLDYIDTDNMFICGGSQGGLVTVLAAEELGSRARAMAVYNPAVYMPDNWRATFKNESDIPETYDFWGFKLGKVFFTSIRDYYPINHVGSYPNNVLILQGDKDTTVPLSSSQSLQKKYKHATLNVYPGEGHSFKPAASQQAREDILEFIKANTIN